MDIFGTYARTWQDQGLGFGQRSYEAARAAGLTNLQIQQGLVGKRVGERAQQSIAAGVQQERQAQQAQLQQLTAQFQQQMKQQQAQFAEAQRRQQEKMEQFQQQALQAQTRQAAPQQTAQVLGVGKSLTIRPGARTRFSRPELQIKSVNI